MGDGIAVHDSLFVREIAGMFAAHQDDFVISPVAFDAGDGRAALEYTFSYVAVMEGGKQIDDVRVATIFNLDDDGLITRSSDYFNAFTIEE